jgi:surface polysaccharide O-acyltransferase-like enzyme
MLIGLYLFIPIIGSWVRNASKIEIHYFLIVWLFSSILNSMDSYRFLPDINILYFSNYIGYLVLGYYLSQKTHSNDFKLIWQFILLLFWVCTIFLGTFYYSKSFGHFDDSFDDYLSLFVIIMSICVFIIFKELSKIDCKNNYIFYSIRNFINKYNYGIYLAHVLILNIIERIGLNTYFETALIDIPLMLILCLFLSAVLVFIINKLPFGSYYSG